jgi:predicted dehydrogenase
MGAFIDNELVGRPDTVLPVSHAAGYEACQRTELVACADLRTDVMETFGKRYNVPTDRQYTDYRLMIDRERPDIVSVATQPEQRAEIVIYAAEHGARAIYAEKAMAASMDEADAMVEAVERNGVLFHLGTQRRWDSGFDKMKELIDGGELGALRSLITYELGHLFNMGSHQIDLLLRLNSDRPVAWVQGHLPDGDRVFDGNTLLEDPQGHGIIQFEDGVTAYAVNSGRGTEWEAVCERGVLTALSNGLHWRLRRQVPSDIASGSELVDDEFPDFPHTSSNLNLIEDLVHSLDTGEPSRGGVRVAHASTELIFAFIESHLRGGARVELPLKGSKTRLQRPWDPRQPKYQP